MQQKKIQIKHAPETIYFLIQLSEVYKLIEQLDQPLPIPHPSLSQVPNSFSKQDMTIPTL